MALGCSVPGGVKVCALTACAPITKSNAEAKKNRTGGRMRYPCHTEPNRDKRGVSDRYNLSGPDGGEKCDDAGDFGIRHQLFGVDRFGA